MSTSFRVGALAGVAVFVAASAPAVAAAQVGSTTDIVTGKVVGVGGQPVAGAQVTVTSAETGVSRTRTTSDKGTYTVLFPDGGGRYRITVRAIGQQPRTVNVQREGDEDRLVANVSLAQTSTTLAAVRVTARAPTGGGQRPEPGNSERTVTTEQALRLPIDASDPNALASITPGVISQGGNDTTQAGFSVAGQRASQNNVTLDGVSFGGASFPQEAVRATRIITNTFDVARGQFSGGQVASTTRSGTNTLYFGSTYTLRAPQLQQTPDFSGVYGQGYTSNQLSAGVGGAFKKDQAFYFVAVQGNRRTDPLASLLGADPRALAGLGASSDSVARFLSALSAAGIPTTVAGIPGTRVNQQASGIARVDFNLGEANTLTVRGDYRYQGQDATRISPFAVPTNGGTSATHGGGLFASLSTRFPNDVFGGSLLNEGRVYATGESRAANPYVAIPGGRVRLTSTLPDNSTGLSLLSYGANAGLPSDGQTNYVEATDELSLLSGGGGHRFKLGGLLNASRYDQQTAINPYGTYTYNTLQDFLANTPALFQRTLTAPNARGGAVNAAGYLGDTWRQSRNFQLTYGARVEASSYSGAPAYNAAVDKAFGLRTDRFPGEVRVSPRVGFTYTFFPDTAKQRRAVPAGGAAGGAAPSLFRGGPTLFVRGGIGEFRGRAPTQLFSAAQQGSGLAGDQTQITCLNPVGPDYAVIAAQGVAAIPTTCVQRAGAPGSAFRTSVPTVAGFAPDFEAPRSVRASLGVTRRFWERWTAGLDASYAWGVAQYGISDVNLRTNLNTGAGGFTLPQEGNRPVYVPASAIIATSGAAPLAASRVDAAFGQVLQVGSGLRSRNAQATATLGGFTSRGVIFNLSWTVARNRDQTSYAFGPPAFGFQQTPTAGNPNVLALASADQDVRHNVIGTLTYPLNPSLEFTTIARVTSGSPYTPTVGGDVNGDGARNDAAFVFDPKAGGLDPALAAAMQRVLDNAPTAARACLEAQLGHVAGRNSCRGPWVPGLDFQFNYKPDRLGLQRRLTVSALLLNPLAGLDQALHGANNLRGWGQFARADQTLLAVRGFDAANQRYVYDVNERFGSTRGAAAAFRQTFQLGIQARYVYGANAFGGFGFGGGPGGGGRGEGGGGPLAGLLGGGAGGAGGTPSTALAASLNPAAKLIDLRDSLGLDSAQVRKLEPVRDSLAARYQRFRTDLQAKVKKLGSNPDPALIFSTIRPDLARGRQLLEEAVQQSQAILTPAQWAKVGDDVKNPFRQAFGGPPGGGRRP